MEKICEYQGLTFEGTCEIHTVQLEERAFVFLWLRYPISENSITWDSAFYKGWIILSDGYRL